jgi:UDP-N-acetylglucosamine 2-epimerase (non-hydrolysing)
VDDPQVFERLLDAVTQIQQKIPILFPAHPRTVRRIDEFRFAERLRIARNLRVIDPLGYLEFLDMMMHAKLVLTDSGGIQEETTILGIPCLTIRENTERPVTITQGTNVLVGTNPERIVRQAQHVLERGSGTASVPELWDGHAAERIVQVLQAKTG